MVGMAVPTMLASRAESAVASITAMITRPLWAWGWGVPVAGVASRGAGGSMVGAAGLDMDKRTFYTG